MKDKYEEIQQFLENLPDQFEILEEGVDMQTQKEYIEYSGSFAEGELTEEETLHLSKILFSPRFPKEAKQKSLTLLAHLGTILAFRKIEKYYNNPDKDLKKWAALALQECKMFLESSLTDESKGFISGGLGGSKNCLRIYFLLLSSDNQPFPDFQYNVIKEEITRVAGDLNCTVENFDFSSTYVGVTALVPLDVAVGTFIDTGIKKCNELGNFVFEYYYVTNQNIPDSEEIKNIIKKVRED